MKGFTHRTITRNALELLPEPCKRFFTDEVFDGATAIDCVVEGSSDEDVLIEPLGMPRNLTEGQSEVSTAVEDAIYAIIKFIKEDPTSEHFWNHDFGYRGLVNPAHSGLEFRAAPERAEQYWNEYLMPEWNRGSEAFKSKALKYLGRVIHLVQDMGVPAHVHGDAHLSVDVLDTITFGLLSQGDLGLGTIDDDDFECYVDEQFRQHTQAWPVDPMQQMIFYSPDWRLRDFFRHFADVTVLYDSDDVDGFGDGQPYRWYSIFSSSDPHRDPTFDLTDYACNAIAANLVPMSYSFTAGMYLFFLRAIGFPDIPRMYSVEVRLNRITVHHDTDPLSHGEININFRVGNFEKRYGSYKLHDGESMDITGQNSHAFLLFDGQELEVHFDVYDDDSWYFEPNAKESLGNVNLVQSSMEWTRWLEHPMTFAAKTSNGYATVEFTVHVRNGFIDDAAGIGGGQLSMERIMERYPPLRVSTHTRTSRVHYEQCHHQRRIDPDNTLEMYLFKHEFEALKVQLRDTPVELANHQMQRLFKHMHNHAYCKTCERLAQRRGR